MNKKIFNFMLIFYLAILFAGTVFADNFPTIIPENGDLAEKIKNGSMHLADIPLYVKYATEFLTAAIGTISLIHIIVGGYQYILGGLTDDKESGKKRIMYAIIGLIVSALAWVILDKVVFVATG